MKKIFFADDSTVYKSGENLDSLSKEIENELIQINNWLTTNKFNINVKKN